ncbi:MAG: DegV family protein [Erysipelothrix sp.]|nr:DegV family protein [Erysipelothrix sp.]
MKKIAFVCDSSISLTPEQIKETGVFVAPLAIIHQQKEYEDQVTISTDELNDILRVKGVVTTSQPNLGLLIDLFTKLKAENYDYILGFGVTSHLSGTYRSFSQAAEEVGLDNFINVDTMTLAGPIQRIIKTVIKMNEEDKNMDEIMDKVNYMLDNNESYLLPKDLNQLKAGGRISPAAATMASLLRIKAVLKLENRGLTIDKFATARTDAKALDIIIDDLIKHNVKPETHYINLLHCEGEDVLNAFKARLEERIGKFDSEISLLPASLAAHAGLGTITIQYTIK